MSEMKLDWYKADPPDFHIVPEKRGVYIISTRQSNHEYEVKYVGQAENLRARAAEHWSRKEKNRELKQHIAENFNMKLNYALVDSKFDRDGIELYLYELYDPAYNNNSPPCKNPISCRVPDVKKHH